MKVTTEEVLHIAKLAEIEIPEGTLEAVSRDMSRICDYVEQLGEVPDAESVESFRAGPDRVALRDDHVDPSPLAHPVEDFAPEMADGFFLVPRLEAMEEE